MNPAFGAGARLGPYELGASLGAGGMGEVYRAHDARLGRDVAIKILPPDLADDPERLRRFAREARAAAALNHPNVLSVYDVGDEHGVAYLVTELLEGQTLRDVLTQERMPVPRAIAIGIAVAEGLAAAHAAGIIHRDLKPENLFVTRDGRMKILDFGIAKVASHPPADSSDGDSEAIARVTTETDSGHLLGTVGYMAPEQIRGQPIDQRSDIFALGCVLYEMLAGHRAFAGATPFDTLSAILRDEPASLSAIENPTIPPQLAGIVEHCLEKESAARLPTARDLAGELRTLSSQPAFDSNSAHDRNPTVRPGASALRLRWQWSAIAATAGVAALIGVAVSPWPGSGRAPAPSAEALKWYRVGSEALREGTYVGAKNALNEATRLYPEFMQAHARLADSLAELDEQQGAQAALLRVASLASEGYRLAEDDEMRLEAIRFSVLREHRDAIRTYESLAAENPSDAGAWVDVGRAHEAASQLIDAREHYARALSIDKLYAAAHMRFGSTQARTGDVVAGLASLREGVRLFKLRGNIEGQVEALLRIAVILRASGAYERAAGALTEAERLATEPGFRSYQVRARFELAWLAAIGGKLTEAEEIARRALDEAQTDLHAIAANGLIDLANVFLVASRFGAADAYLTRALELADRQGARRTEARAQLQRASLRLHEGKPSEAIALAEAPLKFFEGHHYVRSTTEGKLILARAYEALEQYGDASRLTEEALKAAEAMKDAALRAMALENLAGQLFMQGRLPEALRHRERIEEIHRAQNDHRSLAFDLPNRAELLILLGRGAEAETALAEVDRQMAAGIEIYRNRKTRVESLRALRAAIEGRPAAVVVHALAAGASMAPAAPPAETQPDRALLARVLLEYAHAQLGRAGTSPAVLHAWTQKVSSSPTRRNLSYWVGLTLLRRGEAALAHSTVRAALQAPQTTDNPELHWRLAALALLAGKATSNAQDGAAMRAQAENSRQRIATSWGEDAPAYFARHDLTLLNRLSAGQIP